MGRPTELCMSAQKQVLMWLPKGSSYFGREVTNIWFCVLKIQDRFSASADVYDVPCFGRKASVNVSPSFPKDQLS